MNAAELLAPIVGPKNCLIEDADIAPYAVDWRGIYRGTPRAVLAVATVAALAVTCAGAVVVSRNQKRRLPIPYGVAISAGGLLVLLPQIAPPPGALAAAGLG